MEEFRLLRRKQERMGMYVETLKAGDRFSGLTTLILAGTGLKNLRKFALIWQKSMKNISLYVHQILPSLNSRAYGMTLNGIKKLQNELNHEVSIIIHSKQ
jgi:hypothetical protein